ncbi:hypothetical protein CHUAL_014153 [Chamberlinius hualienensis]
MNFKVYFVLLYTLVGTCQLIPTPCNENPKPYVDKQILFDNSPMTVYYTTWSLFKCGSTVWVRPQIGETGFNMTGILLAGGPAVSVHLVILNNYIWDANFCSTGLRLDFPTIFWNFDENNHAFCVGNCNGASYNNVICWGKTDSDKELIKQYLDKIEILGLSFDAQTGCDLAKEVCKITDRVKDIVSNVSSIFPGK